MGSEKQLLDLKLAGSACQELDTCKTSVSQSVCMSVTPPVCQFPQTQGTRVQYSRLLSYPIPDSGSLQCLRCNFMALPSYQLIANYFFAANFVTQKHLTTFQNNLSKNISFLFPFIFNNINTVQRHFIKFIERIMRNYLINNNVVALD